MKTKLIPINPSVIAINLLSWLLRPAFTLALCLYFNYNTFAQTKIWDKTFGGDKADNLNTIVLAAQGGYLLGGTSLSGVSKDKSEAYRGKEDYWVVRVDDKGQKVWDKTFGGTGSDELVGIVPTKDGGYLLAGSSLSREGGDKTAPSKGLYDYWVVKINAEGQKMWDKSYGGKAYDRLATIVATPDGGFVLGGTSTSGKSGDKSEGTIGYSADGVYDFWILKIDESGIKQWDKTLGTEAMDELTALIPTPDNGFLAGGMSQEYYFLTKIDGKGNPEWGRYLLTEYNETGLDIIQALLATPDGNYVVAGWSESGIGGVKSDSSRGASDMWLLKLDPKGNKIWDKTYGGQNYDFPSSLVASTDGGYLVAGYSESPVSAEKSEASRGGFDYWLLKLDANGQIIWDKTLGGTSKDALTTIITTRDGNYLLGGSSKSGKTADKSEASRDISSDENLRGDFWIVKIKDEGKNGQAITFDVPVSKLITDKPFNLQASASSNLPVALTIVSGPATIKNNVVTLTGAGLVTVKASQSGNATYLAAPLVIKTFMVGSISKQWDKTFGGNNQDYLTATIKTPDGGYLLGGSSLSGKNQDKSEANKSNDYDYWVIKTDKAGNKIWDKTLGGTKADHLTSLLLTPDGGYLIGGYSSSGKNGDKSEANRGPLNTYDYWIVKLDASGNKVWDNTYGGKNNETSNNGDLLTTMVAAPGGGYLLGGTSNSGSGAEKSQANKGAEDYWILKIDEQGHKIWDKVFGGSVNGTNNGVDNLTNILVLQDGGYLLGGYSWSGASMDKSEPSRGFFDYWIIKIDGQGKKLWDKTIGGNGSDQLRALQETADGYLLGGSSTSGISGEKGEMYRREFFTDFWVVKTDLQGNKIWDKTFGGTNHENMSQILISANGNYVLGGTSYSGKDGDKQEDNRGLSDIWLVTISTNGVKIQEKTYGGNKNDNLTALLLTAENNYLLSGSSDSEVNNDKTAPNKGLTDYWMLLVQEKAASHQLVWNKTYGGTNLDGFTTAVPTTDGGYLLGGHSLSGKNGTKTQASFGGYDFWVVKTDKNGKQVWDKRYGGTANDYLNVIMPTQDGGYILGGSSNSNQSGDKSQGSRGDRDFWIVKINSHGTKLWDKRYGGSGFEDLRAITILKNGDYLLGGYSDSPAGGDKSQPTQGKKDYWVVRVTPAGEKVWDKRFGGSEEEELETLAITKLGNILLGGSTNSGPSGNISQDKRGGWDYWLVEIDESGSLITEKRYGGPSNDKLNAFLITSDNNYLLAGSSTSGKGGDKSQANQGEQDYWVIKITSAGSKIWDKRFGGQGTETLQALMETPNKEYVLAGSSTSGVSGDKSQESQGESDYWLIKTDAQGNRQWDQRYGGDKTDELRGVWQTKEGAYVLGGRSNSGIGGDKTEASWGNMDYWLLQISPDLKENTEIITRTTTQTETQILPEPVRAYPNPLQDKLTVQYTAPQTQLINVLVYDSQGREVARLYQGSVEAGQEKQWEWQPDVKLLNGLYFIRVQAADEVLTSKLLLNR
ncbi:T9SS type A sorting domain-containing protein [Adhaeribacter swui]|uniref:T9SS type A sorting domain-containing protein n=1 Tax=Adhaeribacter swui TaxID=2086471 RepID=A0A7G7G376_9BACT|nr:T9SS type A sorting domain-containing protein [Adhaeribacter swui]QNF31610.1 T9SS type A sorting domain-containing protein [Adhaeribacter swui]